MRLKSGLSNGPKTFSLRITSNAAGRPEQRVRLRTNLSTLFVVEPKRPTFHGFFDEDKFGYFDVTCHEREPFDVFEVVIPNGEHADGLEVESIETLRFGLEYRVHVRAKPTDKPLRRSHLVELRAHYPDGEERVQRVYVAVVHEPRITTTPTALIVPGSKVNALERTGDPLVETVTLRHAVEDTRFEVVDAYCDPDPWDVFTAEVRPADDGSYAIDVKLWSFPRGESHLRTQLIVETDDPDQPRIVVEVVVYTGN